MRKFISTVLSAVVLMGLAASPQISSAAPPIAPQRNPGSPEATGDDISFVQPRTVLRFGNDRNFNTVGVARGDFNGDGKLDLAVTGTRRNTTERNAGYLYITLGNGDGTFQGAAQYPAPTTPAGGDSGNYCPLAKDFDGDGKLDVMTTANEIKKVAFFKGRGDGNFLPAVTSDFPETTNCIQAADLNGDGKPDLVSNNYEASKLMLAFGNGDGTFQTATAYALHGNPNGVSLGDVNGDGKSDIVYSAYNDPKFGVLLNNGSGGFPTTPLQVSIGGKNVMNLTLADFSGDGKLDVLATAGGDVSGTSHWAAVLVRGNGDGTFQAPVLADYTNDVALLARMPGSNENVPPDLNGDGKPDLVLFTDDNAVTTLLNNGSGQFANRNKWAASAGDGARSQFPDTRFVNSFVVGDFNGDDIADIVTGSRLTNGVINNPGGLAILIGAGNGRFVSPQMLEDSFTGRDTDARINTLADFTGDGKLDLLSISRATPILRAGNGDGSFGPSGLTTAPTGPASRDLVTGDVNGDSKLDAAYLVPSDVFGFRQGRVFVSTNTGSGFNTTVFRTPGDGDHQNLALGDFNGDGKLDLALKLQNQVQIMLAPFPNDVSAESTPFYTLTLTPGDYDINADLNNHVHAADLNGDGKVDLLAHSRNGSADNLEFFKGNGNGTFAAPVSAGKDYGDIFSYVTRDLDGDGKLDLVAAGNYAIWVAKGAGDGTFSAPTTIGVSGGAQQMAMADFNGDNKPDIVATYAGYGIQVHPGKGDGTFGPPIYFAKGTSKGTSGIMAGDVNSDGKPDLVTENGRNDEERFHETVLINTSGPQADLAMTLRDSREAVSINTPVRFVATITNTGSSTAAGVTLRSVLPASTWAFDSAEASQGSCSNAAGTGVVSCVVGSMPFSTTQVVTITVRPIVTGALAATASVSSTLPDVELGNNGSATRITVSPAPAAFVVASSASASSGSLGSNANGKPVITMRRINKTAVPVSVRINKSKLPNGIPSSRTVRLTGRYFGKTYVMVETVSDINISVWTFTIPPDDIVDGPEPVIIQVVICGTVCGGPEDVVIEFEIVIIQLFDPSGIVTDRATGQPIASSTVTLYKVPGALPDEGGTIKQCRTVNTRPGGADGTWDSLPPATLSSGVLPDIFFDPGEISPAVNPQQTSSEGRYGWDVVKGCWFVKVEATGYKTVISALVGVPPAVTDLNIKLDKAGVKVFLPLLWK